MLETKTKLLLPPMQKYKVSSEEDTLILRGKELLDYFDELNVAYATMSKSSIINYDNSSIN